MYDKGKTSVIVFNFKVKGDVMRCESYRGVKLQEHVLKIVFMTCSSNFSPI